MIHLGPLNTVNLEVDMSLHEFFIDNISVNVRTPDTGQIQSKIYNWTENGTNIVELVISSKEEIEFPKVELEVKFPLIDTHSLWTPHHIGNPSALRNKGICEYNYEWDSKISQTAPVACFYSLKGENRLALSLSEAMECVQVRVGAYEEERCGLARFELFKERSKPRSEYSLQLRLDNRDIPFTQAVQGMAGWYDELLRENVMTPPAASLEPVFSTWYNFHQNIEQTQIEEQCALASEVGCKTIILDDGWQTDDNNRGYQFCGDWLVSQKRFPDFAGHVERVQAMGMKYMLWLSVPYMGKKTDVWSTYEDYMLFYNERDKTGVVDPRYKKVRDYLVGTYCRVVKDYNLDGLKLDFIDQFDFKNATGKALEKDSERTTESLQEAVNMLMLEVRTKLEELNPDILIEFRQKYIGPMMRQFGNMFRVHDCPHDSITNRMGIMDLRLFSHDTTVHSDMFIWTPEDSAESASLQFINTLFSVPQISPDMKEISAEHFAMTKHWLTFWQENKDVLMKGELECLVPEMHYPVISGHHNKETLTTVHADMVVDIFTKDERKVTVVNGALEDKLCFRMAKSENVEASFYDCLGRLVKAEPMALKQGLVELEIPKSGYVIFKRV